MFYMHRKMMTLTAVAFIYSLFMPMPDQRAGSQGYGRGTGSGTEGIEPSRPAACMRAARADRPMTLVTPAQIWSAAGSRSAGISAGDGRSALPPTRRSIRRPPLGTTAIRTASRSGPGIGMIARHEGGDRSDIHYMIDFGQYIDRHRPPPSKCRSMGGTNSILARNVIIGTV